MLDYYKGQTKKILETCMPNTVVLKEIEDKNLRL